MPVKKNVCTWCHTVFGSAERRLSRAGSEAHESCPMNRGKEKIVDAVAAFIEKNGDRLTLKLKAFRHDVDKVRTRKDFAGKIADVLRVVIDKPGAEFRTSARAERVRRVNAFAAEVGDMLFHDIQVAPPSKRDGVR